MADVLVDTSVWIQFLRRSSTPPWRANLSGLLDQDVVVIVDPTVAELLLGTRGGHERDVVLHLGGSVRRAVVNLDTWIAAGDLGRSWRSRGRMLSLVDCLLATVAMRDEIPLWTLDKDFGPLTKSSTLRLFTPGA